MRESGVWLNEHAQNYTYALLMHFGSENKRADHAVKCISTAPPDCATTA
jgi:hypothetical protein